MKAIFRRRALMALPAALASLALGRGGQSPAAQAGADRQSDGLRLPNGRLQRDEILKAEYEQNLKDAARLVEMAEDLKQELEKNERFVLSMSTLKKTDDIEKLVRRIRSRLRH